MSTRWFYSGTVPEFLSSDSQNILGSLARENPFDLTDTQRNAWLEEIDILRRALAGRDGGQVLLEYSIPRLGKRADAVVLLDGIVFVMEFKAGETQFKRSDIEQVWDYALDLKNFHEGSRDLVIVPILIATEAPVPSAAALSAPSQYNDRVWEPICAASDSLRAVLDRFTGRYAEQRDLSGWAISRYNPTPTIIQAASALYLNHTVEEITRSEAAGESLKRTGDYILEVINTTRQRGEKAICFVTGIPGAGKTLVGLNTAVRQFESRDLAVYLSGNQPLVSVLSEALARDKKRQEEERTGRRYNLTDARRSVKSFIQIVHHYRNETLNKLRLPIRNQALEIDPAKVKKHADSGYSEVEHVAIFDEAQRAWTQTQLANWLKRRKRIDSFPMSEPEFLIWSLDLRDDWAVIVCLVGGGQEIGTGEAGIGEWIRALNQRFPRWRLYISDQLTGPEYGGEELQALLDKNPRKTFNSSLHLAVSMRSFRAERLSDFVNALLIGDVSKARDLFSTLANYPIALTRSLDTAKGWLRRMRRGSERYGLVVSSQAQRLRPLAIDVRCKPNTVHWFLDDITDIRSSLFLEDVVSEFDIQGLELDWTGLVWDGDLRRARNGWKYLSFSGSKWKQIKDDQRRAHLLNAYRVLLTRARQGMVICVPEGDTHDETRQPAFYDGTFHYLKNLGLPVIG